MARIVNIDAPSTTRAVNAALRTLGWTQDQLEFVRGNGYSYVVGDDAQFLAEERVGESMYDGGPMGSYTVAYWVDRVLELFALAAHQHREHARWLAALPVLAEEPDPSRPVYGPTFTLRVEGPRRPRFDPVPVLHRLEEAQHTWRAWKRAV